MEEYLHIIKKSPLFAGIGGEGLASLLGCLGVREKRYKKNSFIFSAGDTVEALGLVLAGGVHIIQEDFWGNRNIMAAIEEGGLFAEAFSCAEIEHAPVSALAAQDSVILLMNYQRIVSTCPTACDFHSGLVQNMLRILAQKNVMLTQKMELLAKRRIRDKLLSYLSAEARRARMESFDIPFNRQELAEYLAVDRSALSNELSHMRQEGLLNFTRNRFELLRHDEWQE